VGIALARSMSAAGLDVAADSNGFLPYKDLDRLLFLEKEAFTGVETAGQFGLPSVALTNACLAETGACRCWWRKFPINPTNN
jgi:hypothetical protein